MRIEAAELQPFRLRLRTPLATALGPVAFREGVLLSLRSADGCIGYGEATPLPAFGTESLRCRASFPRGLRRLARGSGSGRAGRAARLDRPAMPADFHGPSGDRLRAPRSRRSGRGAEHGELARREGGSQRASGGDGERAARLPIARRPRPRSAARRRDRLPHPEAQGRRRSGVQRPGAGCSGPQRGRACAADSRRCKWSLVSGPGPRSARGPGLLRSRVRRATGGGGRRGRPGAGASRRLGSGGGRRVGVQRGRAASVYSMRRPQTW